MDGLLMYLGNVIIIICVIIIISIETLDKYSLQKPLLGRHNSLSHLVLQTSLIGSFPLTIKYTAHITSEDGMDDSEEENNNTVRALYDGDFIHIHIVAYLFACSIKYNYT